MGTVREKLAYYLKTRERSLCVYKIYYLRALAAMASGSYKDTHDLVNDIAGEMTNIMYNKDNDMETGKNVNTPQTKDISQMNIDEIREYWKSVTGRDWGDDSSWGESSNDTVNLQEDKVN